MPTCSGKKSTVALHPIHHENCERVGKYEAEYTWKKTTFLSLPHSQNQRYQGEFFRDSLHGQGTYRWENLAVFEGSFYSNVKEGYACVSFPNNCYFEGLFVKNRPFGPGIYTYANGRQDAGFWMGKKLVRLSRAADYIIPRLAPTCAAKIKLLQFRRLIPLDEMVRIALQHYGSSDPDKRSSADDILQKYTYLSEHFANPYSGLIYDPRSAFFEKELFEKTYFINITHLSKEFCTSPIISHAEDDEAEGGPPPDLLQTPVPNHCLCSKDMFEMTYTVHDVLDLCERDSITSADSQTGILYNLTKYGTIERPPESSGEEDRSEGARDEEEEEEEDPAQEMSKVPKIVSWNRSELCTEMLKQIFRYRAFEDKLNFDLAKLMIGARTAFRRTGLREKECLHFLKMCSLGPPHVVKDLLCSHEISEELMDARGNNSLMFAAAADQLDTIDILLDYGVDVNTFNDEGLTPLNLCLLRRLAQANKISNWEAAYLPKEIDLALEAYDRSDAWECQESISSLDRVFGDGMSINDSRTMVVDDRWCSPPITSSSLAKDRNARTTGRGNESNDDSGSTSQITVFHLAKSPKSPVDNSMEEVLLSNRSHTISNQTRLLASNDPTPKLKDKLFVKTNKRDEFQRSIMKTGADKYLFEFTFASPPVAAAGGKKKEDSAKSGKGRGKKEEPPKVEMVEEEPDSDVIARIQEIDRTIEKLLKRGADPNVSEVPKPSIHLAVYTKDIPTVRSLLMYGANPDSQLYPNEGLLTPLHVLVLLKPSPEFVLMGELLLSFGANPEEETRPEFSIHEEEKGFLDNEQGRTPLQLLCMRPDVEYGDPKDHLIEMALMLAGVSNGTHFYNGHSCLTLAMFSANLKMLKALLQCGHFDPNDVLGKDRGTVLHVLVSTEFQKKSTYETSVKICDLLLEAGADPAKKLKSPAKLLGTCIDYGYREIEAEKDARKASASGKKDGGKGEKSGKEKGGARDHLKDHARVIEYLKEVVKRRGELLDEGLNSKGNENVLENGKKSPESTRRVDLSKASGKKDSQATDKGRLSAGSDIKKGKVETAGASDGSKSKGKGGAEEGPDEAEKKTEAEKKSKQKGAHKDSDGKKHQGKNKDKGNKDRNKGVHDKGSKDWDKVKDKGSKDLDKGSNFPRDKTFKTSKKNLSNKACSETFPEKVRQNLLRLFGNCINIDVNELLLPYVVLRDGELYYRFQGRGTNQKEQYSLI